MTALHVWNQGDALNHTDLNLNFSACANAVGFSLTVLNVRNYGALGDNTDQTAAIDACVAAAKASPATSSSGGARIYFPAGSYVYSGASGIVLDQPFLSLEGDGREMSTIIFRNGTGNGVTLGSASLGTRSLTVRDIGLVGDVSKTGGMAINVLNNALILIQGVSTKGMNGIKISAPSNTVVIRDGQIYADAAWCTFGLWWFALNDGSQAANGLIIYNTTVVASFANSATGLIWEGMCVTLVGTGLRILKFATNFLIKHTGDVPNATNYPQFCNLHDLELEGAKTRCLEIRCGLGLKFTNCDITNSTNSAGQGGADDDCITIAADNGGSGSQTRNIDFSQVRLGACQQRGIFCDARDSRFVDFSIVAPSIAGSGLWPAFELGANARDNIITAFRGGEFNGSGIPSYALKLTSGAQRNIVLGLTSSAVTGAVLNSSGNATNTIIGTIEPNNAATNWTVDGLGTAMIRYDTTAGTTYLRAQNSTTGAGTAAGWAVATATANSVFQGVLHDNSGAPYYQENSGAAITTRYSDSDTQNWRANNATQRMKLDSGGLNLTIGLVQNFANDAAAATGGIAVGGVYRNGSVMMIRVT